MTIPLLALALLATLALPAIAAPPAPDENTPNPQRLREQEQIRYDQAMRVLQEQKIDMNTQRTIDRRNCKNDRGCMQQVEAQYRDKVIAIDNKMTEEIALHRKALLEIAEMDRQYRSYGRLQQPQPTQPQQRQTQQQRQTPQPQGNNPPGN